MKAYDWTALDGVPVIVWMPEPLRSLASRHLWRHSHVPDEYGQPMEWLREAWTRFDGDAQSIGEAILWLPLAREAGRV